MPTSSHKHDDEIDQQRPDKHQERPDQHLEQRKRGAGATAAAAPTTAKPAAAPGTKAAIAPRVNVLAPTPHGAYPAGPAPLAIEVFGTPNTSVVLYVTIYHKGAISKHEQVTLHLSSSGEAMWHGTTTIDEWEHYGLHARVEDHAGKVSPLKVVEYAGQKETKGGGV